MIDIFIKSFNRPYYLDRCLYSIQTLVSGNYKITILDDGTPEKYLQKIKEKYPSINIIKSKNYQEKNQAIADNIATGKEINGFEIPTDLWYNAVKNASEYMIMTEDDVWFTEKINVDELSEKVKKHKIYLLKLGTLTNRYHQWANIKTINEDIIATQPNQLFLASPMIMDCFFYNKFKFYSFGYRLGIFNANTKKQYWLLNTILMGFWNKEYWLYIWEDAKGKVDEPQQLRNASCFYRKHQNNPNFVTQFTSPKMWTTFISSATNSYHKYGIDCDINMFNHIINEEWYADNFDSMQNFPKDISEDYYTTFLDKANNPKCLSKEWKKWAEKFKEQYRKQGVNID